MKSHAMLILFVAVIAAGCTSSQPADTQTPPEDTSDPVEPENSTQPTENEANTTVITHTNSGFSPETVTIQAGETVVWESDAGNMWVASDQHPSHTEYSGTSRTEHCQNGDQTSSAFDQCSAGDRFSFTFEQEGEWSYHNHENSFQGGTVVVE